MQSPRPLPIQLHQIKLLALIHRRIILIHRPLQLLPIQTQLIRELLNRIGLFRRLVRRIVHPAALEALPDVVVRHEEAGHVLVAPALERDHLEGGEEVAFALYNTKKERGVSFVEPRCNLCVQTVQAGHRRAGRELQAVRLLCQMPQRTLVLLPHHRTVCTPY
jgi:hypothetical protein